MFPFTLLIVVYGFLLIVFVLERIIERTNRGLLFKGPNFWVIMNAFSVSLSPIIYNYDIEKLLQNAFLHTDIPLAIYLKLFFAYILTIFAFYFSIHRHNPKRLDRWILPSVVIALLIHTLGITYLT